MTGLGAEVGVLVVVDEGLRVKRDAGCDCCGWLCSPEAEEVDEADEVAGDRPADLGTGLKNGPGAAAGAGAGGLGA